MKMKFWQLESLTYFPETLSYSQALEQFHAANVGAVHFRPFCRIQVAFSQHTVDAKASQLEGENQPDRASTNHQNWRFVMDSLVM